LSSSARAWPRAGVIEQICGGRRGRVRHHALQCRAARELQPHHAFPVLSGEKSYAEIVTHDDDWYATHGVTCRFGEPVLGIDPAAKVVEGKNGPVPYDRLVIATGSAPFIIPVPGKDLPGVITYRDLDDTNAMIAAAETGGRAVVIGGGLLGLEAAAGLAERGMDVTVVHLMGHLMERQLDPAAGYLLRKDLERRGIAIRTEASTKEILGETRAEGVLLDGEETLPADLVVMAVGIRPETRLAADGGARRERAASRWTRRCRPRTPTYSPSANASNSTASFSASWRRFTIRRGCWRARFWARRTRS
jgi:NAD(P)H-nitrite reductase large subunit